MKLLILTMVLATILWSCNGNSEKKDNKTNDKDSISLTEYNYPDRTKKSNIYEVNIRQYTPEGTFAAFEKHIPRLKKMGVDILWIMPIYPISKKNRKGSKGSYYAVANYKKVNPEFGTDKDFAHLVKTAHENGMLLILDWVANHTGWDNPWIVNKGWYTTDSTGKIIPPVPDWTDVADLNYDNKDMRKAMIDALKYWVKKYDVDGYRCDVAGMVPTDFWEAARAELDKVKPVFMLAEGEKLELHKSAFDMGYAWNLHHVMNQVAQGKQNADSVRAYFEKAKKEYPKKVYRMAFTSNHDENSWNGTVFERMKDSYKTWAVFSFVVPGLPLIYSGQEAKLNKRLKFFEKDTIDWSDTEMQNLYTKLIKLKNDNPALWNGEAGGDLINILTDKTHDVFAFSRKKDNNEVIVFMNLTNKKISFIPELTNKNTIEYFTNKKVTFTDKPVKRTLNPWEYQVFIVK